MKTKNDIGILIIRLVIAIPMLMYGITKLFHGIGFIEELLESYGIPSIVGYNVYIGEILAPIAIIIGYRTRLASLIFTINCLVALLLTQTQYIFALNDHGGWAIEQLAIFSLIPLALYYTGAGKLALSTVNKWD